jgi:hypothetical protein
MRKKKMGMFPQLKQLVKQIIPHKIGGVAREPLPILCIASYY